MIPALRPHPHFVYQCEWRAHVTTSPTKAKSNSNEQVCAPEIDKEFEVRPRGVFVFEVVGPGDAFRLEQGQGQAAATQRVRVRDCLGPRWALLRGK